MCLFVVCLFVYLFVVCLFVCLFVCMFVCFYCVFVCICLLRICCVFVCVFILLNTHIDMLVISKWIIQNKVQLFDVNIDSFVKRCYLFVNPPMFTPLDRLTDIRRMWCISRSHFKMGFRENCQEII